MFPRIILRSRVGKGAHQGHTSKQQTLVDLKRFQMFFSSFFLLNLKSSNVCNCNSFNVPFNKKYARKYARQRLSSYISKCPTNWFLQTVDDNRQSSRGFGRWVSEAPHQASREWTWCGVIPFEREMLEEHGSVDGSDGPGGRRWKEEATPI